MSESPLSIPEFVSTDELKRETSNDIFQELTNIPSESNVLKTNFEMPNTKGSVSNDACETKLTADKSQTKIVRIIKLKPVKLGPRYRALVENKKISVKVDRKNGLTKSEEFPKIKTTSDTITSKCSPERTETVADESDLKCNNLPSKKMKHEECKKQYRRERQMSRCYQCEMEPKIYEPSDPRRHICQFCQMWLPNHIEFQIHVRNVHNKNAMHIWCYDFYCYVCEKKFPFRNYLVHHLKVHNENADHLCETCGLRFKTKARLNEHLKSHEERTYECDQCGKVFKRFARLTKHFWCHNTDLSFVCKICSKAFKMKRYLMRHMAVHNDSKINCRYCDASFNFSSVRRIHEKSRHNVV